MKTSKLISKLNEYFDLSGKEQAERQDKLLEFIGKLEDKKAGIMQEMAEESERDETSERFHELGSELKVVAKLLKKARKNRRDEQSKSPEAETTGDTDVPVDTQDM